MKKHPHILSFRPFCLGLLLMLSAFCPVSLCAMGSRQRQLEGHEAFLEQLQPRDSILIADQIRYGVRISRLEADTRLTPLMDAPLSDSLMKVRDWHLDTLRTWQPKEGPARSDVELSLTLTSFEAGRFRLPGIAVERWFRDGIVDTLRFEGREVEYLVMPVDTATFRVHDLKKQIHYPVTFVEVLPWVGGVLLIAALIALGVFLFRKYLRKRDEQVLRSEPPHIIALRKLDAWRGDKYWTEDKQKQFYSGVTDALREYIAARYGIGAMEMTSRELFDALKGEDIDLTLRTGLQKLFETADFVKFAKMTLPREENATVVPFAVQFVTATYEQWLRQQQAESAAEEKKE